MASKKLFVSTFLGPPGSGKSFACKKLAVAQAREEGRIIIAHDPMNEWAGIADYIIPTELWWDGSIGLKDFPQGCLVVIDEADMLLPKAAGARSVARDLLNYGRHRNLVIYMACRRPAALHNDALAFTTEGWCFKSHLPRDLKVYEEWFGFSRGEITDLPEYHALVWPQGAVQQA